MPRQVVVLIQAGVILGMASNSLFEEFIGSEVKAPYRDGSQFKVARGTLSEINNGFVKIVGRLGTIIINEKNIEKMSLATNRRS